MIDIPHMSSFMDETNAIDCALAAPKKKRAANRDAGMCKQMNWGQNMFVNPFRVWPALAARVPTCCQPFLPAGACAVAFEWLPGSPSSQLSCQLLD